MEPRPIHGLDALRQLLGHHVQGLKRWVLDLGGANSEFGHGVTILEFDGDVIAFRPGPNEDYIVVEPGAPNSSTMDPEHWTLVDLCERGLWSAPVGKVEGVALYSDGLDDIAALIRFQSGEQLLVALVDTDFTLSVDPSGVASTTGVPTFLRDEIRSRSSRA